MEKAPGYPEELIDSLEVLWGAEFLSPGGVEEVSEILRDIEVAGASILDLGCGVAGPAITIARDLGARQVVGIDVEPLLIERAARYVSEAGLRDRIDLELVAPGPLPFAVACFDIVFSKDSLLHIEDKPALFAEIARVLRPGGIFAASDWLAGENAGDMLDFARWRALSPHDFSMQTRGQAEAALRDAGFTDVSSRDRNAWYVDLSRRELARMEGPLRERFLEVGDAAAYEQLLEIRRANAAAALCGGLRPTHLRGMRPE